MKNESESVLEKQMEIFKNLRNKRGGDRRHICKEDIRVLGENTSDYDNDYIAQPMGEVLQTFGEPGDSDSDEFVTPEDLRQPKKPQEEQRYMGSKNETQGIEEPQRPNFEHSN